MSLSTHQKFDVAYGIFWVCVSLYIFAPFLSITNSDFQRGISSFTRVKNVCEAKLTCSKYSAALKDCSVAYDIKKCTDTRMSGEMYFMCKENGQSRWSEGLIEPNYLTCEINQGLLSLQSLLHSHQQQ
jgi:hypothetical protein